MPNALHLELKEPRPSDEGLYSCLAHSPLGQVNTSMELRLEGEAGLRSHEGWDQLWCLAGPC